MEFNITSILQSGNNDIISSNGKYVHHTTQGRANFKKWFKSSKVKDVQGRPQIMFHGTFQCFDSFEKSKIGARFSCDNEGFFAISCQKLASEYAVYGDLPGNPHIMPLFVSLQNPLIVDKAFLNSEGMAEIGIDDCVITFWDNYQDFILTTSDARKCDGVLLIDSSQPDNIITMSVAFSAKQMKSAIGNSGSFNPKTSSLTDTLQHTLKNDDVSIARKKLSF